MRAGILNRLATLLAMLSWLSHVSGQQTKVPPPESLSSLRGQAEEGQPRAQFKLGGMYVLGQGAGAGLPWGRSLVPPARRAGERLSAQFDLGLMYAHGRGVAQGLS